MDVPSGSTDRFLFFLARDSATLEKKTGLAASISVRVVRDNSIDRSHPSPVIQEVDATNRPGLYRYKINFENELGPGHNFEEAAVLFTATDMIDVDRTYQLIPNQGDRSEMSQECHHIEAYGYDLVHTVLDADGITPLDISSYTGTKQLAFVRPGQGEELVTAAFTTDGTDGKLSFTVTSGFWDIKGRWRRNARIQKTGVIYRDAPLWFDVVDVDPDKASEPAP